MLINIIEKCTTISSSSGRWLDPIEEESLEEDTEESDLDDSSSTDGSVNEHLAFLESLSGIEDLCMGEGVEVREVLDDDVTSVVRQRHVE